MAERERRLFVDMDGTLAVFSPVMQIETLYEKGYFESLPPQKNVLEAVKLIIRNEPEIEVNILSAFLTDSPYALDEKNAWLDKYLPEISRDKRIFLPCGSDKAQYVENLRESDYLLDDYTQNLKSWEPPARGIKLLTDINNTKGSWESDRIRFDKPGEQIAEDIVSIVKHDQRILDENPQRRAEIPDSQIIGVTSWKSGEREAFTDADTFITTVKEELEYRTTSGFKYQVLTHDPYIRKSIDDLLYNLSGEKNSKDIAHYANTPLRSENERLSTYFANLQNVDGLEIDVIKDAYKQGLLNSGDSESGIIYGANDLTTVAVFGDTMSALSHASLARLMFYDYSAVDRLVVGRDGFEALKRHLEQNPRIKNIIICFNADGQGNEAALRIKDSMVKAGFTSEKGYHCERQRPNGCSSYNEYLRLYRAASEGRQITCEEPPESAELED